MARVTIEDCIDKLPNRFELVLLAAHRARLVSQGAPLTVDRDRDKDPVVALREIAAETINKDDLREEYIHARRRKSPLENSGKPHRKQRVARKVRCTHLFLVDRNVHITHYVLTNQVRLP